MKFLVYTFRTFPEIARLEEIFGNVFVFGKLRKDLEIFKEEIKKQEPDLILGLAKSLRETKVESTTINQFHGKMINPKGPRSFNLFVPDSSFAISNNMGTSFCNWTAYNISQESDKKLSFFHLKISDLKKLELWKLSFEKNIEKKV